MRRVHHIAIIASDYDRSRRFYVETLGLPVIREVYREERNSWKCDLDAGNAQLELFSFPDPPPRPTRPEACGLRHDPGFLCGSATRSDRGRFTR